MGINSPFEKNPGLCSPLLRDENKRRGKIVLD